MLASHDKIEIGNVMGVTADVFNKSKDFYASNYGAITSSILINNKLPIGSWTVTCILLFQEGNKSRQRESCKRGPFQ